MRCKLHLRDEIRKKTSYLGSYGIYLSRCCGSDCVIWRSSTDGRSSNNRLWYDITISTGKLNAKNMVGVGIDTSTVPM